MSYKDLSRRAGYIAMGLKKRKHTDRQLLDILKKHCVRLGRAPTPKELRRSGSPSMHTFRRRFGTFAKALRLVGCEPNPSGKNPHITERELLDKLATLSARLGRAPSVQDLTLTRSPSWGTYARRFGSYANALKRIGVKPNPSHVPFRGTRRTYKPRRKKYSDERALKALRDYHAEFGKVPSAKDLNRLRKTWPRSPSSQVFLSRFGSWNKALVKAGFPPTATRGWRQSVYTNDELLVRVRELKEKLGRLPGANEYKRAFRGKKPHLSAIYYRFGNWRNALLAAGFAMKRERPAE